MFKKKFDFKFFAAQLKIMLQSGLSLNKTLLIMSQQSRKEKEAEIYNNLLQNIESGLTLAAALAEEKIFTDLFIEIVRAGEKSGSLVSVLASLEEYYKSKNELKKEIKKACFYPLTVLITLILAASFIFKFILPVFVDLFAEFNGQLPLLTRILLRLSLSFNQHFILFLIFSIFIIFAAYYLYQNTKRDDLKSKFILKIPFISTIYKDLILCQIAVYLSLLLKSGLKLITSLKLVKNIINDYQYKKFIQETTLNISKGASIKECFADSSYIPDIFYYFLMTGEETAKIDFMLKKAGDYYYSKLKTEIEKMLQYLEPLLITLTAIFVALLAAAVIMPMFQIYLII